MAHTIPGSILTRKEPKEDGYDDVRVIGFSPVSYSSGREPSEWTGSQSKIVTVTPVEFGKNIDVPVGKLEDEYDVVSVPDERPHAVPEPPKDATVPLNELPSPEDVFKAEDKGKSTGIREQTPLAPAKNDAKS